MGQIAQVMLQIISFLLQNKEQIKTLIMDLEGLIPDASGSDKASQVRNFIATALGIESKIESVWPLVAPIFNAFVSHTKTPPK